MKLKTKILTTLSIAVIISLQLLLVGCAKPSDFLKDLNTINVDSYIVNGKTANKPNYTGNATNVEIFANFSSPQELNTILINVSGTGIEEFEIYDAQNDTNTLIYRQDYIDTQRYCTFTQLITSSILLKVTKSSGKYSIKDIKFALQNTVNQQFRTTAYITTESLQDESSVDLNHFNTLTDIILFGSADFDKEGNIVIDDKLAVALDLVKKTEKKLNKNYTIYFNFLFKDRNTYKGSWEQNMKAMAKDITLAMKNNGEKLANLILEAVAKYEFDGVAFDWEYPMTNRDFDTYGNFLAKLKGKNPNLKISVALASWGIKFDKKYYNYIDVIELMTYDLEDKHGNHSPFYTEAIKAIDYCKSVGISLSKIDLGIPFYARPTDMAEIWTLYKDECEKLGKYGNYADGEFSGTSERRYYNSFQMTYDKTSYSLDIGLGGVMVWHYACDAPSSNELSLFNSIAQAISDRK